MSSWKVLGLSLQIGLSTPHHPGHGSLGLEHSCGPFLC